MARLDDALPENAAGDYFVDRSCIDCDLCRQLAPEVFARSSREGQSFVRAQPADARGERYGCERILHRADVSHDTHDVEVQPEGVEPVRLAEDLLMIPVPGHTRGSAVLLYAGRYLFTGDHLWADEDDPSHLSAGRGVAWYSWREQARSMERLLDHAFEWVLPGHGRRFHAPPARMRQELERVVDWMKRTR